MTHNTQNNLQSRPVRKRKLFRNFDAIRLHLKSRTVLGGISIILILSVISCAETNYNYLNDLSKKASLLEFKFSQYEPTIHKGQELCIAVSSLSKEGSKYFRTSTEKTGATGVECLDYVVDINGNIDFPLIGNIQVYGLNLRQCTDTVKDRLSRYLEHAHVWVKFQNYSFTVLGEVNRPGEFVADDGKINVLQAIAMAGDLTQFAKRNNILITRAVDRNMTYTRLDLTTKKILESEFFYLHPEDVIYVESNKGRIANSKNLIGITSVASGIGMVAAVFITTYLK